MEEYLRKRTRLREILLDQILSVFAKLHPVAVHLLGSTAVGHADALSDLDLWITLNDEDVAGIVSNRDEIFARISPLVIKHENPVNSPVGGKYSLVIHRVKGELCQVDYYLSPVSTTRIRPEARLLFGRDDLPRGEWILDTSASANKSLEERVDFLTCMSFIAAKKIARGSHRDFLEFLLSQYYHLQEANETQLMPIPRVAKDSDILIALLDNLGSCATGKQKAAIRRVRKHVKALAELLPDSGC